jgi:two-component system, cell cycle sensor histidine kinase and response regulator CckA
MKTVDHLSPAESERTSAAGCVLVVDDETAVRRFAARVLEREGFSVLEAEHGADALELLATHAAMVEVVVSDIVMPHLNGVELMERLATSYPDLPVILMSGYATAALADLGIASPCSVIPKPFASDRLLEEVRRCLKRK